MDETTWSDQSWGVEATAGVEAVSQVTKFLHLSWRPNPRRVYCTLISLRRQIESPVTAGGFSRLRDFFFILASDLYFL